ncbi:MAG: hypothetical protein KAQ89_02880 [Planctomycetes bacterium]|nr:hypothetical protein [Planctomycetota bacterium]
MGEIETQHKRLDTDLCAIVIGRNGDSFCSYATDLLAGYDIKFIRCGDIYTAFAEFAANDFANVLIVGNLEQLSAEDGLFFRSIKKGGSFCCCFAGGGSAQMQKRVLLAEQAGSLVINQRAELEKIIARLNRSSNSFARDKFRTTKAERDALLGV